jgi:AcrR family transcriptional regulator
MEEKKHNDRRVKYTKAVLRDSLVTLLQDRPINKISVTALCKCADINRGTFYTHYADPYDLLRQIERDLLDDMGMYISGLYDTKNEAESLKILMLVFDYIIANAALFKALLAEREDTEFVKDLLMIVQRGALNEWGGTDHIDDEALEYAMIFGVYGSIGVIRRWLRSDLDKTAVEMSNIIMALTVRGIAGSYFTSDEKRKANAQ